MYYATVHGAMKFVPSSGPYGKPSPVSIDHWNVVIDATTGEIISVGTSGNPLP
jgi:hypothetical protein